VAGQKLIYHMVYMIGEAEGESVSADSDAYGKTGRREMQMYRYVTYVRA
jgi:hypothetical protein